MQRWIGRVAVVTGAAGGIGEVIAADLLKAGLRVAALDIEVDRLDRNRSQFSAENQKRFFPLKCDVSQQSEVKTTFGWIEKALGGTDILVNNAAIVRIGNLVDMDMADVNEVLDTNVKGLIQCSQEAIASMKKRNFDGHIIHLNSICGHKIFEVVKGKTNNVYPATKFAVTAINDIMRNELRNLGTKIKTTSISPGVIRTKIVSKDIFDAIGCYLNLEDVSQAVMYTISTPPHVQVHELIIKPIGEMM